MRLHPASRETLAIAKQRLDEVLGGPGGDPERSGRELLSVAGLLVTEVGLRRALGDGSTNPDKRVQLARRLLDGKLSPETLQVIDVVAGNRWSTPRELVTSVQDLGNIALLTAAERTGELDRVESELFQVGRVVGADPELERALSDDGAPDRKARLVQQLFGAKVHRITTAMVEFAVAYPRGRFAQTQLEELSELAAQLRQRSIAQVTTASPLSDDERNKLAEKLTALYGRPIAVQVEVRPDVLGGLRVRVGDEVIDGTSAGRIAAARSRLAG